MIPHPLQKSTRPCVALGAHYAVVCVPTATLHTATVIVADLAVSVRFGMVLNEGGTAFILSSHVTFRFLFHNIPLTMLSRIAPDAVNQIPELRNAVCRVSQISAN